MFLAIFHEKEMLETYVEIKQVDHSKNRQTNTDTDMKKKQSHTCKILHILQEQVMNLCYLQNLRPKK